MEYTFEDYLFRVICAAPIFIILGLVTAWFLNLFDKMDEYQRLKYMSMHLDHKVEKYEEIT